MSESSSTRIWLPLLLVAFLAAGAGIVFYWRTARPPQQQPAAAAADALPQPGTEAYEQFVSTFNEGVAALDVDARERAQEKLAQATKLVPGEPAGWADLGLLELRLGDFESAGRDLNQARTLEPKSGAVEAMLGLLEGRRGQFADAVAHLRRAVELAPGDLKSRFALAREIERQGGPESGPEVLGLLGGILEKEPENLVVLLERARLAAKLGDATALRESVAQLGKLAPAWPARAKEQYQALEQAGGDARRASTRIAFLRNLLVASTAFRQSLEAVETPVGVVGEPIRAFLKLPAPASTPSPADQELAFTVEPLAQADEARGEVVAAVSLNGKDAPSLFVADGKTLRGVGGPKVALAFPGGTNAAAPSPHGVLSADLNSDYLLDFVLAGEGGVRVYVQKPDASFDDVTSATKLETTLLNARAWGVWAADIEMDGDLDLVLGGREGAPSVLRNNSDGTYTALQPFEIAGVAAKPLRDFAWADLDQDGDPDAALLDDAGALSIFDNERSGKFRNREGPADLGKLQAITVADVNSDGVVDLIGLREDGTVARVTNRDEGQAWDVVALAKATDSIKSPARLFAADLDNNGSADVLCAGAGSVWVGLADGSSGFRTLGKLPDLRVSAVADLNGDGVLDLAGLSANGRPARGVGRGSKGYHWQVIRPRAARVFGDGRINSFGVGGEVEVRSGLLVQKQVIAGPALHFGLGGRKTTDVARIVWPNGTVQAEFDIKADQALAAEQRLKGSCPFLYAYDGTAIQFVTDVIWRSPLGLRINAQDTAGVSQTEDWVKIRGDQLAPRDGYYDLRVTAELWETHYFDHMALLVVDHPAGTEVWVDERFARQPPPLAVQATGPLTPVTRATDDSGNDVTERVRARDGHYLDSFGRGFYQGVTHDHWVEIELGDTIPRDRPLRLVAQGWIHPTDSSINVALGQGRHDPPQGLMLETQDATGAWKPARTDIGFPAGKNKTILIDLDGLFPAGGPRKLRLRTNLEVFWDALAVAVPVADPQAALRTQRLGAASAELRLRGYSAMTRVDDSSPELPRYGTLAGTAPRWRDLVGFYTRCGDVSELLTAVDDRYVIANAGDELALRFQAPPPPAEGWVRDFVFVADGWNKDGDYNTAFSRTVLPLPSHSKSAYDAPPGALEDDPVFRLHENDWREYHTRYVTPRYFQSGLSSQAERGPRSPSE